MRPDIKPYVPPRENDAGPFDSPIGFEARTRVESGEELARAHAEIQRQAVLMEQLVRELGSRPPPGFGAPGVGAAEPSQGSGEDSR